MAYPPTKPNHNQAAFTTTDDRSVVSGLSTATGATAKVSDNTGKSAGTVRNRGSAGVLVGSGGRDAAGSTIASGY